MKVLAPAADTLSSQVGDEFILLSMNAATPQYFGLHGSANRIWQLIEAGSHTEESICQILSEEFDAPEEVIRQDVSRTVTSLEERSLLRRL